MNKLGGVLQHLYLVRSRNHYHPHSANSDILRNPGKTPGVKLPKEFTTVGTEDATASKSGQLLLHLVSVSGSPGETEWLI